MPSRSPEEKPAQDHLCRHTLCLTTGGAAAGMGIGVDPASAPDPLIGSASVPSDPPHCRAQLADPETRTLSPPGKPGHRASVPAPRAGKPHPGVTPGFPKSLARHSQRPGDSPEEAVPGKVERAWGLQGLNWAL